MTQRLHQDFVALDVGNHNPIETVLPARVLIAADFHARKLWHASAPAPPISVAAVEHVSPRRELPRLVDNDDFGSILQFIHAGLLRRRTAANYGYSLSLPMRPPIIDANNRSRDLCCWQRRSILCESSPDSKTPRRQPRHRQARRSFHIRRRR